MTNIVCGILLWCLFLFVTILIEEMLSITLLKLRMGKSNKTWISGDADSKITSFKVIWWTLSAATDAHHKLFQPLTSKVITNMFAIRSNDKTSMKLTNIGFIFMFPLAFAWKYFFSLQWNQLTDRANVITEEKLNCKHSKKMKSLFCLRWEFVCQQSHVDYVVNSNEYDHNLHH